MKEKPTSKNLRLAVQLGHLSESLKDAAVAVETIKSILLEKESIPAAIAPVPSVCNDNKVRTPKTRKAKLEYGIASPENTTELDLMVIWGCIKAYKINHDDSIVYKRIKGLHRGSIIIHNLKTNAILDYKFDPNANKLTESFCMVSEDQDGADYINGYVYPHIKNQVREFNKSFPTSLGKINPILVFVNAVSEAEIGHTELPSPGRSGVYHYVFLAESEKCKEIVKYWTQD